MSKKCLITGASKGIGAALARQLAQQGYDLALLARTTDELDLLKRELEFHGVQIRLLEVDLTHTDKVIGAIDGILEEWDGFDVLVNNAGMGFFGDMESMSIEAWDQLMSVNLRASFLVSKYLVKGMKKRKRGHILTVASDVSKRVFAGGAAYCASKYAQDALFSALRKEVHSYGIKVSMVYPGLVDTDFHASVDEAASTWLQAEDVANAIAYILNAPKHVVIDELMIHPMSQDY